MTTFAEFELDVAREHLAIQRIAIAAVKEELSRAYMEREQSPFADLKPCVCGESRAPTDDDDSPEFETVVSPYGGHAFIECPWCGRGVGAASASIAVAMWNLIAEAA